MKERKRSRKKKGTERDKETSRKKKGTERNKEISRKKKGTERDKETSRKKKGTERDKEISRKKKEKQKNIFPPKSYNSFTKTIFKNLWKLKEIIIVKESLNVHIVQTTILL
ncbi:hypothetical protein Bpfe_016864 [Biomphalaria pfeifferi]|uniref:Uncharacterized protein n=1 Tax=Biomphalaria pfeifferi TaxID=112525 RepID=A0AAD8F893_BIOPF|nr:hypothetical protein Bpfe_016864 [Biomphalaria pfeifferi]